MDFNFLKEYILNEGAVKVGFSKTSFAGLDYCISYFVKLSDRIISEINDKPTYTYFNHYRAANTLIDQIGIKTGTLLTKAGYDYYTIPASQTVDGHDSYKGSFSHKQAALNSGIGFIGKNALFINEEYGPSIRLGTIFTNMELPCNEKISESKCGNCNKCVVSCPALAISGEGFDLNDRDKKLIDVKSCSDYMKNNFKMIGRGVVCGICIKNCKYQKGLL